MFWRSIVQVYLGCIKENEAMIKSVNLSSSS